MQHSRNTYNLVNWLILSLYVASFTTRFIAQWFVDEAEKELCKQKEAKVLLKLWRDQLPSDGARIDRDALDERNRLLEFLNNTKKEIDSISETSPKVKFYYFMQPCARALLSAQFSSSFSTRLQCFCSQLILLTTYEYTCTRRR